MVVRKLFTGLGIVFFLQGCASTDPVVKNPYPVLRDDLFPSYTLFEPESEEKIFALDEDAMTFVNGTQSPHDNYESNIRSLVDNIFDYSALGLQYRGSANSIASETFQMQTANCLSLSIMTYAMAEHAGFDAQFYEVDIPEYWTRREGYSLLNGHVNLRITTPKEMNITRIKDDFVDVDFDPQAVREYFPRYKVSKKMVLSMFYNNKGADALIANSYSKAYAYFRKAAVLSPQLSQSWGNLGILYRKIDAYDAAEVAYKRALELEEDNLTAWENLAILYRFQGRVEEADEIVARVERRRDNNPFYHFLLGEEALAESDYEEALTHYRRAMRLDDSRHEIWFGLAKTYFELGDISRARAYIERAARYATNPQDENRYLSKLSVLHSRVN